MYYTLTKSQKKVARKVMDKGLKNHYQRTLSEVKAILEKPSSDNLEEVKDKYLKLYNCVIDNDKNIGRIYDDKGGSRWVEIMILQLANGVIKEEDLQDFNQEIQDIIISLGNPTDS